MKYMSFIFENQDVRNTVVENEAIVEVASNALINANVVLEDYIYANLARFTTGADSLADIYENIRNFVISENVSLYSQYSEILSDNELSPQQKAACFYETAVDTAADAAAKGIFSSIKHGWKHASDADINPVSMALAAHVSKHQMPYGLAAGVAGTYGTQKLYDRYGDQLPKFASEDPSKK